MLFLGRAGWRLRNQAPDLSVGEAPSREEVTAFNYERSEPGLSLLVTGEAANVDSGSATEIRSPSVRLETGGKIIKIQTAAGGTAELNLDPATGRADRIQLRKGVRISRQDSKTEQVEFVAQGEEATYDSGRQEILLTGNPVISQGNNEFRGERIRYLLRENRILIENNASGIIHYEEKGKP